MAEVRQFGSEGFDAPGQDAAREAAPGPGSGANPQKYCVYNQTRERFVATDVEGVPASPDGARARLRAMGQDAGTGLWIRPTQEISATSIRFPVDLVFLDGDSAVLAVVESFPLASVPAASAKALSLIAFPADTVANGELRAGDQLMICKPEEMKHHLQRIKEAKAEGPTSLGPFLEQFAISPGEAADLPAIKKPFERVVDPAAAAPSEETQIWVTPIGAAPVAAAPAKAEIAGAQSAGAEHPAVSPAVGAETWKKRLGTRSWLTNLLMGDPVDPRNASREVLPGLIAYYFTGGNPVAQEVRDISATGIYIVTNERWYPGTVVRVTLTDRDCPSADRTLTVNAKAIRWGKDGVGLELVLEKADQRESALAQAMERTLGVDPVRVESFLQNLKTPPPKE